MNHAIRTYLSAAILAGCATTPTADPDPVDSDLQGLEELAEGLTDLSLRCTTMTSGGVVAIALLDADIALINKSTTGALLINGYSCGGALATGTALKQVAITGSTGANTVILDYLAGTFALGTATLVGITVDLGTGTDALKIRGTKTADTVTFGASGIVVNGDATKDITAANVETFAVTLSDGADVFSAAGSAATGAAFATAVTVYGGLGNDTLRGGDGDDTLDGGDGVDTFQTGTADDGAETYVGGAGSDVVDYSTRTAALTVTMDGTTTGNDGETGEADKISDDVETVKGGAGADSFTGNLSANIFYGGAGSDTLIGGAGLDQLFGEAGDDTFDEEAAANGGDTVTGGAGTDTIDYSGRSADTVIKLDNSATSGEALETDKIATDVENVLGGSAIDTITGSASANVIDGGAGADRIDGGAGADTITGGGGADVMSGGTEDDTFVMGSAAEGSDTITGGTGVDKVDYSARTNALTIVMDGVTPGGETGEATTIGTDVEALAAGAGADAITGNAADNVLEGGAGVDTITGLAGDDILDGGLGADVLDCGAGDDINLDPTATATFCEL